MKNLLVAQSGGPSAAINATVVGVVESALASGAVDQVFGAINGIAGVFDGRFLDLRKELDSPEKLRALYHTPGAALGSCRLKLKGQDPEQFERLLQIFREHNIGYFVYIGGNDSMDTVWQLSRYLNERGIDDIKVMGAPKTIDNDLVATDHCPGYGSAAKYIATTFAELRRDCDVYYIPAVTIVEVMGRNAGWLTAASALSRLNGEKGPNLIYLCETVFDPEKFLQDVQRLLKTEKAVLVAVSEGIKDASGAYVCEKYSSGAVDAFGHSMLSGTAKALEILVRERIGCKARSIELSLMQRCGGHIASATDLEESRLLGMCACSLCLQGVSGKMATILRQSDEPYAVTYGCADIQQIANEEKKVPLSWIDPSGSDVRPELLAYMKPLIQGEAHQEYRNGVPCHITLY